MDDYLVCSDLCEEKGFQRQAELLRAVAGAGGKVYLVAERGYEYNDEYYSLGEDSNGDLQPGQPRTAFVRRDEAEAAALRRDAEMYRSVNILSFGLSIRDISDLAERDLNRRIGAILGREFRIRREGTGNDWDDDNPFPSDATDEQMARIVELFKVRFFHVIEVEFAT